MKMDKVAGSGNDEFYTPMYAITPLIKYLKDKGFKKILCPFDTKDSKIYKVLLSEGFEVEQSHINDGIDFFERNLSDCDCIVSNPPYSLKAEVFETLFATGKPFAMLVGVVGLFESQRRFTMFANNTFEIMYINKRISYHKDFESDKTALNPPFSSVWLTSGVLPQQIMFEVINK